MQKLNVQVKFIEKSQPYTVGSVNYESSVHRYSQKFNKGRAKVHDEENMAGIITNITSSIQLMNSSKRATCDF